MSLQDALGRNLAVESVRLDIGGIDFEVDDCSREGKAERHTFTLLDRYRSDLVTGGLYFFVGSTYAIRQNDHEAAVRWYEKALPYFNRIQPSAESATLGRHGQRLVSMGVSYWEIDVPEEGIRLTEEGLEAMLAATDAGTLKADTLAVPYGNLAAMYESVGRDAEAEKLAAKAAQLEAQTRKR